MEEREKNDEDKKELVFAMGTLLLTRPRPPQLHERHFTQRHPPVQHQTGRKQRSQEMISFLLVAGSLLLLGGSHLLLHHTTTPIIAPASTILTPTWIPLNIPPPLLPRLSAYDVIQYHSRLLHTRDIYTLFLTNEHLCHLSTRCTPEELQTIITELAPRVRQPRDIFGVFDETVPRRQRACHLTTENRICMVLVWMAHYEIAERVGAEFGVRGDLVHLDIYHILPIIIETYSHLIHWPSEEERQSLHGRIPYFHYSIGFTDASHSPIWKPGTAADRETEYWCTHGDER